MAGQFEKMKKLSQMVSRLSLHCVIKPLWFHAAIQILSLELCRQLKELAVGTAEMSESHITKNISEHMRSVTADLKIYLHHTVITTDNATNIVSAIERCDGIAPVKCMAHVLNLAP